ncbi:hypothetical protein OKW37_002839 [Paraburkholderia sp. MM5482-R2]
MGTGDYHGQDAFTGHPAGIGVDQPFRRLLSGMGERQQLADYRLMRPAFATPQVALGFLTHGRCRKVGLR